MSKLLTACATALFIGTKTINAKPMNRQEYNELRGWEVPADENPTDEGYLVEYVDSEPNHTDFNGYISWSPKAVFEKAYKSSGELSFGHAIEFLKQGKKVARKGWNGAGQFVYYVPANTYPADQNPNSPIKGHFDNDQVPYRAYLALKTAQNDVATWQPSISDVLADDWVIVE